LATFLEPHRANPSTRYLNMDYLVFSVMAGFAVVVFNLSYDIACQWHKKLWPRMASMPPRLHLTDRDNKIIRFFVPKFHLNAHVQSCQTAFSFNFGKNVGRTDGEAPERGWANINRVASSTKEMGKTQEANDDIVRDLCRGVGVSCTMICI
jgi:hypothetical protein